MPVVKAQPKGHRQLVCDRCGHRSRVVKPASPAAPDLTACEALAADGWGYSVGFQAMLLGHIVICPDCNGNRQDKPLDGDTSNPTVAEH